MRIAVADDNPIERSRLARLLRDAGHSVVGEFDDGLPLVRFAMDGHCEAVFSDIVMPEMTGIEVLRRLSERVPVVLVTGQARESAAEAYGLDAAHFIEKPLSVGSITKALQKLGKDPERQWLSVRDPQTNEMTRISWCSISRFEVDGRRILACAQGRNYVTDYRTLREAQDSAPQGVWDPVYKGIALRLEMIEAVEPRGDGSLDLVMRSGGHVRASRSARQRIVEFLGLSRYLKR